MSTNIDNGVASSRQLVATALTEWADDLAASLEPGGSRADSAGTVLESVLVDIALARVLAGSVTGWTHTTRVREFLNSDARGEEFGAHLAALHELYGGDQR